MAKVPFSRYFIFMPFSKNKLKRFFQIKTLALLLALLLIVTASQTLQAASTQQVDEAIKRATKYLLTQQKDGHWELFPPPSPADVATGQPTLKGGQWGGATSLATYSLLAAGENPQSDPMKKAMAFLADAKIVGIYALGMRAQVWSYLPAGVKGKAMVNRDGKLLQNSMRNFNGEALGMFWYTTTVDQTYDHSVSQYGILGMWACAQNGYETPFKFWSNADTGWRKHQAKNGGWAYTGFREADTTPSMTAAGVATLFITQDYLHSADFAAMRGNPFDPAIEGGLKYMGDHFKEVFDNNGREFYTLYGVERIGVAAGRKYLGTHNWYEEGANWLLARQNADGSFGGGPRDMYGQNAANISTTSFAILFLVRGRAPVIISKLEYNITPPKGKSIPANWNARPRDIANLTRWIGKELERDLNWVSLNLTAPLDELNEAPILYIAGSQALSFTPEEKNKLRQYVEQGGLILGNADAANAVFAKSFAQLGKELFPSYEFGELPASAVIFTGEQFPREKWKNKPLVQHLSNGARELMLLIPQADFSKYWQTQTHNGKEEAHELADDIVLYAVEKKGLMYRGDTYIIKRNDSIKAEKTLKLARLQYSGNWDPEPGGWRRLSNVLHNEYKIDMTSDAVELGKGLLKAGNDGYPIAHLTGTTAWTMPDSVITELKAYIAAGGTLIVDSAAGNQEFAGTMEANLLNLFPDGKTKNTTPMPANHKIFSAATLTPTATKWRAYSRKMLGALNAHRIRGVDVGGGRIGVFYSAEDLSVGLVGHPVDGITGYTPSTATELMLNIILASTGNERKPPTQPATAPVK